MGHLQLELLRKCVKYDKGFKVLERGKKLDKYYIISRCPNGLLGLVPSEYFDQDEAKEAIGLQRRLFKR